MTQTEVANILGISQVQVSRIEKKVLEKIRKELEKV
jgi:RNA polymerase sporulation-specific sigma factor